MKNVPFKAQGNKETVLRLVATREGANKTSIIMDSRIQQNLLEKIKLISEDAAQILCEIANDHRIYSLKMEDLNEFMPGECNLRIRTQTMDLIDTFLQEQTGQSMDSSPADVMSHFPPSEANSCNPDILASTRENLNKLLPGERNSQLRRHIMGIIDVFSQEQTRQSMDSSPADVMNPAPKVPQSEDLSTEPDKKQQQLATLNTNEANITGDNNLSGKDTDPAGKESGSDTKTPASGTEVSSGPSGEGKHFIMVFMHRCRDPSHMTSCEWHPASNNEAHVFHCAYNDSVGLLECQENEQVVKALQSELLRYADSQAEIRQSSVTCRQQDIGQQILHRGDLKLVDEESESEQRMTVPVMATGHSGVKIHFIGENSKPQDTFMEKLNLQIELCSEESCSVIMLFNSLPCQIGTDKDAAMSRVTVKVHMLVAGETFRTHETFIQKLKLQIKRCSAESCSIILLFCPVVSRIGTDMEAAMTRVTEDKPVILVFMHHCHSPSHMTNITVQPSKSNIVEVVHCAFHETKGLLQCQDNEQAVKAVRSALRRYISEVPLTQSEIEHHSVAAQNANKPTIINEVPRTGTKPEERASDQSTIVPAKGHSVGPSRESVKSPFSRLNQNINGQKNSSLVKVQILVAGETFKTYETFIKKLNLQIEPCSAESSSVILLFCPVVSQIGTDMEAAMARVTVNKPVILVFMHHCHSPSHMTNITAQPSRSNIVQVVHCAFHENYGLLQCQENEKAVAEVQAMLKKYK